MKSLTQYSSKALVFALILLGIHHLLAPPGSSSSVRVVKALSSASSPIPPAAVVVQQHQRDGDDDNDKDNLLETRDATATPPCSTAAAAVRQRRPVLRFFDLGSNSGDSLMKFAFPTRYMAASGLARYVQANLLDGVAGRDTVSADGLAPALSARFHGLHMHGFEPNPIFDAKLVAVAKRLRALPAVQVSLYLQSIAADRRGTATLYLDTASKGNCNVCGSSVLAGGNKYVAHSNHSATVNVSSIDLAEYVLDVVAPTDFVVVKIDIEGAEYALLSHLLPGKSPDATGATVPACALIDVILLEWHSSSMSASVRKQTVVEHWGPTHSRESIQRFEVFLVTSLSAAPCNIKFYFGEVTD